MNYRPTPFSLIQPSPVKRFILDKFLGVDFTSGDYISDYRRSPDALNMVWGVNPYYQETRHGYKRIMATLFPSTNIWGIHVNEVKNKIIVHAGTSLYILSGTLDNYTYSTAAYTGLTETPTVSFMMNDKLYIIGGGVYLEHDTTIQAVTDVAFVPTTVIARRYSGGGTAFEAVNLLSIKRKNSFYVESVPETITDTYTGDDAETVYTLTESDITSTAFIVSLNDVVQEMFTDYTVDRVERKITFLTPPATGVTITVDYEINTGTNYPTTYQLDSTFIDYRAMTVTVDGIPLVENTGYTVDRETGIVTFAAAPTPISGLSGVDNIIVEFSKSAGTETEIEQVDTTSANGVKTVWSLVTSGSVTYDTLTVKNNTTVIIEGSGAGKYTVDRINKTVTFGTAPATGVQVTIIFTEIVDTRASAINECSSFGIFGGDNDSRVFLNGNSDYKNRDWHSGLYDPTYFPDTGYTDIGNNSIAIMGYAKQYDTQVAIKEGNQQDGSAFLRTFAIDANGVAYFPIEQGSVGIGAISRRCFGYLQGEPLFLSSQGVVGIAGTNVDNQRLIQDRSEKVNSKLTQEPNLDNAFSVEYENKYHLFVNGHVYVADARMRYKDSLGNDQYEWQYWDNVNADCAVVYGNYLLFGYAGMLFRFKRANESQLFIDEDYNGALSSINSYWTTPKLYFGSISNRKKIEYVYMMFGKLNRINANIQAEVNGDYTVDLGTYTKPATLNFADIDFSNFSFLTTNNSVTEKAKAGIKGFDNIKFIFSNVTTTIANSGLGLELIQADYSYLDN